MRATWSTRCRDSRGQLATLTTGAIELCAHLCSPAELCPSAFGVRLAEQSAALRHERRDLKGGVRNIKTSSQYQGTRAGEDPLLPNIKASSHYVCEK